MVIKSDIVVTFTTKRLNWRGVGDKNVFWIQECIMKNGRSNKINLKIDFDSLNHKKYKWKLFANFSLLLPVQYHLTISIVLCVLSYLAEMP